MCMAPLSACMSKHVQYLWKLEEGAIYPAMEVQMVVSYHGGTMN